VTLIYLVAGEQSGDAIGARLMQAIRARRPDVGFAGIGGEAMAAQGLRSLFPIGELAVMGLVEVLPRLLRLRTLLKRTIADIRLQEPTLLVTIDSPGFALRVLDAFRGTALRRAHYVAPQVWAWRENRVTRFPGLWDALLCLLPFEPAFFARHGLPASFVGHPVLESGADGGDAARFRARFGVGPGQRILTVMPGSRRMEVAHLLPLLEETLRRLPEPVVPAIPLAPSVAQMVRQRTAHWRVPPILLSESADKYDAFAASAAALTKSGTSTLELAMAGVPMLVTYRVNVVSHQLVKRLVKVSHASILNLILDRPIVPELLQYDATPERLALAVGALLDDPARGAEQRRGFAEALRRLRHGEQAPSDRAAEILLNLSPAVPPDHVSGRAIP
jgi:lipid-A-disaccharide synthase